MMLWVPTPGSAPPPLKSNPFSKRGLCRRTEEQQFGQKPWSQLRHDSRNNIGVNHCAWTQQWAHKDDFATDLVGSITAGTGRNHFTALCV